MPRVVGHQSAQALTSFAVAGVAFLTVVLAVGNLAVWVYAQHMVVTAAQEAVVVASRENATPLDGQRRARALLVASLGAGAERVSTIDIQVGADIVTAELRGSWPVVLLGPLANAPLHATATLERERFRPWGR
jgi:hypothetical protein